MFRLLAAAFIGSALLLPAAAPPSPPFSLTRRVPFTGSKVVGTPEPPPPYRTRRVFEKVAFKHPLYVISHPKHRRLFVVEQAGRIVSLPLGANRADEFLKLPDADTYGMTFHPDYAKNGFVYVFSNGPNSKKRRKNAILRYKASGEPPRCDPKSRKLIIEWESNGHNGGDLAFGPDGMLYITSGDGTSDSDGDGTGQVITDLTSGILRLDVGRPAPGKSYSVPKDNPFLHIKDARPELWAFGLRNPWRMTFDRKTGELYIADIGQDQWEMIHLGKKGANYGWAIREGTHPFHAHRKKGPAEFVDPLIEHPHSESRSITGGFVYRGKALAGLRDTYLYGDYSTGKIWGLRQTAGKITWKGDVAQTRLQILGIAEGPDGEPYLADYGGEIHKLEKAPPAPPQAPFPRKLSQTGLFARVKGTIPAAGLVPYDVNSPLWSDGAEKERFLALPGAGRIDFHPTGHWKFPEGTVLVKTFRYGGRRVETRLMHKNGKEWVGYSYAWDGEQADATLVGPGGRDEANVLGTGHRWRYPSRAECMMCHSRAADYVLGLSTAQMNRDFDYGGTRRNQLQALEGLGMFRVPMAQHAEAWRERGKALRPLLGPPLPLPEWDALGKKMKPLKGETTRLPQLVEEMPRLVGLKDTRATLEERARSYLHSNCAHCHVEAGGGNSAIDLDFRTPREKMRLIGVPPLHDKFDVKGARLVAPGSAERSILYQRLSRRGRGQMPPLGSHAVDAEAARLIAEWARSLK